jgi:hypothetical protein
VTPLARRGAGAERSPERRQHDDGEDDRHGEADAHPALYPETLDEKAAEGRREDDRQTLEDGLQREARDPALPRKLLAHEGEGRGETKRGPRHHEQKPGEEDRLRRPREVQGEASQRQAPEEKKSATAPESVGQDAARPGVRCVQKVFQSAEGADEKRRRTKRAEEGREEAEPELLAEAENE